MLRCQRGELSSQLIARPGSWDFIAGFTVMHPVLNSFIPSLTVTHVFFFT